jgi:hypothetical protein
MVAGFVSFVSYNADAQNVPSPNPDWVLNLSLPRYPREFGLRPFVRPAATFVDSNRLAVAYAIPAPKGSRFAWELNLLVLNAADGSIQARNVFPMAGRNAGLFRSREGKLVVSLGDGLQVLSPETLSTEKRHEVEGVLQPYSDGDHGVLIKSNVAFVETGPRSGYAHGSGRKVSFVRLDTLETAAECERADLDVPDAIEGDLVATSITGRDTERAIYLGSFCGEWKRISDLKGHPDFLGPDRLVVSDRPDVSVLTTTGKEVCRIELKKHSGSLGPTETSSDVTRFAVRIADTAGLEIPSLDMWRHISKMHVVVYGFAKDACSSTLLDVEIKTVPKPPFDFALSPDGGRLVIVGDGRVSVFRVP